MEKQKPLPTRVKRGKDGKYRWVYTMNLYKDPTVFLPVWKLFFGIFAAIVAGMTFSDLQRGVEYLREDLRIAAFVWIGMTVLVGLGCLIYAVMMGGYYTVAFEMDKKGINHKQIETRAKKLSRAATVAGMASGRLTTAGVGMNAARTELYSDFLKVKKVKAYPRRNLIKISETLGRNQVYTAKEDFEFVKNYILSHCPDCKL